MLAVEGALTITLDDLDELMLLAMLAYIEDRNTERQRASKRKR